jgi:drug/metabolite transporter (DMT)-like permease
VTAVLLALGSAALFGTMTVAVRVGIRGVEAGTATLATLIPALLVALVAAGIHHDLHGTWPFLLAGLLAPGISQLLFTRAVREVGASRTSVTLGAAPLVAVAIAVVFLGEPLGVPLALGALGVVAGGVLLGAERDRPGHLRAVGYAFAAGTAILFAIRDNLVRDLHAHANPLSAAAATLLAGTIVSMLWMRRVPTRQVLLRMTPAGLCFGLSYVCLFEAFWRGRVTVVSPLVATESLWGVALSAVVFRGSEKVGSRLALGALLVVAGGVLIGLSR